MGGWGVSRQRWQVSTVSRHEDAPTRGCSTESQETPGAQRIGEAKETRKEPEKWLNLRKEENLEGIAKSQEGEGVSERRA